MIDPASLLTSKLAALARAGRQDLPLSDLGAGSATYFAVKGWADPITKTSTRAVISQAGKMQAQRGEWE